MSNRLALAYEREKQRFLEQCTACGVCARRCPIIPHTPLAEAAPRDIQREVLAFLRDGATSDTVYTRAFACMGCFKCVMNGCPIGLDPLRINEIIKSEYRRSESLPNASCCNHADPDAPQRTLARNMLSAENYQRLTTPSSREHARFVFFPGCNVYYQPELIVHALNIMEMMTDAWAFVPGLDHCCGDSFLFSGDIEQGDETAQRLITTLADYQPERVIFWCPTCLSRFQTTLAGYLEGVPWTLQSFPQFLAEHLPDLPLHANTEQTATLHEPCKAAYLGVDRTGPRDVLRQLPGLTLFEMERNGEQTACCGSGAMEHFAKSFEQVRDERMDEAARTGADLLVDVCHFCHRTFLPREPKYDYTVVNYVSLVAEYLGLA